MTPTFEEIYSRKKRIVEGLDAMIYILSEGKEGKKGDLSDFTEEKLI